MLKRGTPTVELVNDCFLSEARVIAKFRGFPVQPIVVVPRTIESLPPDEFSEVVKKACAETVELLLTPIKEPSLAL